jgi:hypothetical protein
MAVGAAHTATNSFDVPRGWTYVTFSFKRKEGRKE